MMDAKAQEHLAWEMLRLNRTDLARMQHLLKIDDFSWMS